MDYFKVLNIEPTKDKNLIKRAYMEELSKHNPEEDPEGFKLIRQAYEELMNRKDDGEEEADTSPSGVFMEKVRDIYGDFAKRIDPEVWKELLKEDAAFAIDSMEEVNKKLLVYIMDHYYLPHPVFQILEGHFAWREKESELRHEFHPNFIQYIIANSMYDDNIRYHLFDPQPDKDYDKFLNLYFQAERLINEGKKEEAKKTLDELCALDIRHPDLTILQIRYNLQLNELDKAYSLAEGLLEKYGDDTAALYAAGQVLLSKKNIGKAMPYFNRIIEKDPDNIGGKKGVADCHFEKGEFEEAKNIYVEILEKYPNDGYTRERFHNTCVELVKLFESQLKESPQDSSVKIKLATAYYNTYRFNDCKELLLKTSPPEDQTFKYYDLLGAAYMYMQEYEEAVSYFKRLLDIDDQKVDIYINLASSFNSMDKYDEALEYLGKGFKIQPDNAALYAIKAHAYYKQHRYKEAAETADEGLNYDKNMPSFYITKAEVAYELRDFAEALDNCRAVRNISPYIINSYVIEMKVFWETNNYDTVLEISKTLANYNLNSKDSKFYEGSALRLLKRYNEAEEHFLEMIEDDKNNPAPYTELCLIYFELEKHHKALENISKALDIEPGVFSRQMLKAKAYRLCGYLNDAIKLYDELIKAGYNADEAYNGKGLTLQEMKKQDKAEEAFKKAIEANEDYCPAYGNLADMYAKREEYGKALEFFDKVIEINPHPYYYISRGLMYGRMNKDNNKELEEKQIADYEKTIEIDPEYAWAYNNLGHVYYEKGEYEKSVGYYETAIEKDGSIEPAYRFIGKGFVELGLRDKALEYYTMGIDKFPDNVDLKTSRGNLLIFLKRYDEGRKDLLAALALDPKSHYLHMRIGVSYESERRYKDALRYYNMDAPPWRQDLASRRYVRPVICILVLGMLICNGVFLNNNLIINAALCLVCIIFMRTNDAVNYKDDNTYEYIGGVYYKLKKFFSARYFYNLKIKFDKDDPDGHFKMGKTCQRYAETIKGPFSQIRKASLLKTAQKSFRQAIGLYLKRISEKPANVCNKAKLGRCYFETGNFTEAEKYCLQAIGEAPKYNYCDNGECDTAYFTLGLLYESKGRFDVALKNYDKALKIDENDEEFIEQREKLIARMKGQSGSERFSV